MAKTFLFKLGTGDPRTFTGLSPTFILFFDSSGQTLSPPAITEAFTGSGFYKFTYTPTLAISFLIDGISLNPISRYISGSLDPIQTVDQSVSSIVAAVGSTADSYGSTVADPTSLFGYMKRMQEYSEGNALYDKTAGVWYIYTRGSSTLLVAKTISESSTQVSKT